MSARDIPPGFVVGSRGTVFDPKSRPGGCAFDPDYVPPPLRKPDPQYAAKVREQQIIEARFARGISVHQVTAEQFESLSRTFYRMRELLALGSQIGGTVAGPYLVAIRDACEDGLRAIADELKRQDAGEGAS